MLDDKLIYPNSEVSSNDSSECGCYSEYDGMCLQSATYCDLCYSNTIDLFN